MVLGATALAWGFAQRRRCAEAVDRLEAARVEHARVQERLRDNEARLRAIIESEPECVKILAADGTVLEVNPAGQVLVDADDPADIVGRSIYLTVAPEFQESYRRQVARVFDGEAVVFEFRSLSLKGRERWLETHAVPMRGASGEIACWLGISRDMTARRDAEEKLRRHQLELAHVARLSSMGEIASGIAHELNQPLTAIAGFVRGAVRRLREGSVRTDELVDTLEDVAGQAERAARVIRKIREFTRKEGAGRRPEDASGLVRSVAVLLDMEVRQAGGELRIDLHPEPLTIAADAIMLEQVLCNLVRNAIESMAGLAKDERVVTVSTRRAADGGAEVSVADRGPGIPAALADRVFEPFFTTKQQGVGIGLSISQSIVESHGGVIRVDNGFAGGAIFRVWLPVRDGEAR